MANNRLAVVCRVCGETHLFLKSMAAGWYFSGDPLGLIDWLDAHGHPMEEGAMWPQSTTTHFSFVYQDPGDPLKHLEWAIQDGSVSPLKHIRPWREWIKALDQEDIPR